MAASATASGAATAVTLYSLASVNPSTAPPEA
jgi:hypothetical protein